MRPTLRLLLASPLLLIALACAAIPLSCVSRVCQGVPPRTDAQDFALIQRGRYLVTVADCTACHADTEHHSAFGGGRPTVTPFGTVRAANITPDPETGIGGWTDAQFDEAVRGGRMPNGKRLYPAMPFSYYARMSASDTMAMRAYLATVPPVHHAVDTDQLPFPFSIRASMILWDWLYFKAAPWRSNPARSAVWNRGAYLVEGPGHCGACHTPKTLLGGDKTKQALRGYSLQGWFAPDLTQNPRRGLAMWSRADIVDYLKTGHNRFAGAAGPMAEEVADSSSQMSDADLQTIATYLKGQPGAAPAGPPALPQSDPRMQAGAAIYEDQCSACHQLDGRGVPFLIPDLASSAAVASREPTTLLQVILLGAQTVATANEPTGPQMPSYGWQLSDVEIAAVCTYLRNSWGHAARAVSEREVRSARKRLNRVIAVSDGPVEPSPASP